MTILILFRIVCQRTIDSRGAVRKTASVMCYGYCQTHTWMLLLKNYNTAWRFSSGKTLLRKVGSSQVSYSLMVNLDCENRIYDVILLCVCIEAEDSRIIEVLFKLQVVMRIEKYFKYLNVLKWNTCTAKLKFSPPNHEDLRFCRSWHFYFHNRISPSTFHS